MIARMMRMKLFDVEVSSRCNVRCRFCPRGRFSETGLMEEETFRSLLENTPLGPADGIMFVGMGEPLLNGRLPDFIRMAKARHTGLFTLVATNGTLLTQEILPALLAAGLDTLEVSFNGIDATTYEDLMKGAHFGRTLENIGYALSEISRSNAPTKLQINYIVTHENAGGEEAIRSFWRERGIRHLRAQRMHSRAGTVAVEGMTPLDAPGLGRGSCSKFEHMPFITWKGDVLYCSHDIERRHILGNVRRHGWDKIERHRKEIVRNGMWPEMCRSCVDSLRHEMERTLSLGVRNELKRRLFGEGRVEGRAVADVRGN
jgi:MoaA/NifB/PqqE/SkfB family radical SAM enzyme